MKTTVTVLLATLLTTIVGCASYGTVASIRGQDVSAADRAPEPKQYSEKVPGVGAQALIKRTFSGQPPLIPHATEKYEPITIEENACLDCHISDEFRGAKMPKIGESHFSKTVKEKDGSPAVNMARWQCDSCHVPQVDAPPLVENRFVGK
jgi:cytochrome c-type protein NapB